MALVEGVFYLGGVGEKFAGNSGKVEQDDVSIGSVGCCNVSDKIAHFYFAINKLLDRSGGDIELFDFVFWFDIEFRKFSHGQEWY